MDMAAGPGARHFFLFKNYVSLSTASIVFPLTTAKIEPLPSHHSMAQQSSVGHIDSPQVLKPD